MQRLDLNLAGRPFKNNTVLWVGYGLALTLLVLYTAWNVSNFRKHKSLLAELTATVDSIDTQRRDLQLRERAAIAGVDGYDIDSLAVQADKANEVIAWKAFSWTRLFNLLEEHQPWEVRMNSIRPLFQGRRGSAAQQFERPDGTVPVIVEGTAKTYRAFTEFESVLQEHTQFARVEPGTLKRLETGELLFDLKFLYLPQHEIELALETVEVPTDDAAPPAEGDAAEPPADGDGDAAPPQDGADDTPDAPEGGAEEVAAERGADGAGGDS
ncbi:MAG: hypothetical protein GY716_09450 [bacterium]|nr:hypothetical protein [bacterium]